MIAIHISRDSRVNARCEIDLPVPAHLFWPRMRDVEQFLTDDPLHAEVVFDTLPAPHQSFVGATVTIRHRLLGFGVDRVGRILTWREGRGYAISDLSRRGVDHGFPHICAFDLAPRTENTCTLTVSARGKWTATWVPRPLIRLWLWWVLKATEAQIAASIASHIRLPTSHIRHPITSPPRSHAAPPPASPAAR